MRHYPKIIRIPPVEWLNQTIMSIYIAKIDYDAMQEHAGGYFHIYICIYMYMNMYIHIYPFYTCRMADSDNYVYLYC
jgi:hypothetical protein